MHKDLETLRDRSPKGLKIVEGLIATVEAGLTKFKDMATVGRGILDLSDIQIGIYPWNRKTSLTSSAYYRTMRVALGRGIGMDRVPAEAGITYNVSLLDPNGHNAAVLLAPGQAEPTDKNFIARSSVELQGHGDNSRDPLLFNQGDLKTLSPREIERRLTIFQTLVNGALK